MVAPGDEADGAGAVGAWALGADAAGVGRSGTPRWVGVLVDPHGFVAASVGTLADLVAWADELALGLHGGIGPPDGPGTAPRVAAIGVDIPIGSVEGPGRAADVATRAFVRPLGSTVFPSPTTAALLAAEQGATYAEANDLLAAAGQPKLSKQAWMLVPRILEARRVAALDRRLHEVHPEASFREMKLQLAPGRDPGSVRITRSKKTWNGLLERRRLLDGHGIVLPDDDPVLDGIVSDDVVDAAAVAWSARRIGLGVAVPMPMPMPEATPPTGGSDDRFAAVWR